MDNHRIIPDSLLNPLAQELSIIPNPRFEALLAFFEAGLFHNEFAIPWEGQIIVGWPRQFTDESPLDGTDEVF